MHPPSRLLSAVRALQAVQKQVEVSEVPPAHIAAMIAPDAAGSDDDSDEDYEAADEAAERKRVRSKRRCGPLCIAAPRRSGTC